MKKKPEIPPELAPFLARESLSKTKKNKCHNCGAELQRRAGACHICHVCGESEGCG
jgi:hypothetical protein